MSIRCSATYIHPHFTGNDKGLYATMIGGRIDPSSRMMAVGRTWTKVLFFNIHVVPTGRG